MCRILHDEFTLAGNIPELPEGGSYIIRHGFERQRAIDQALLQLDPAVQSQVGWLLILFQWGPPLFQLKLKTFTSLTPQERDEYLQGWVTSRSDTRRLAFRALKNLSMLGYYSQDATWKGIHYDGPWVPRPRLNRRKSDLQLTSDE